MDVLLDSDSKKFLSNIANMFLFVALRKQSWENVRSCATQIYLLICNQINTIRHSTSRSYLHVYAHYDTDYEVKDIIWKEYECEPWYINTNYLHEPNSLKKYRLGLQAVCKRKKEKDEYHP